jgi:hypothetical protein
MNFTTNPTKRKSIDRADLEIRLYRDSPVMSFDLKFHGLRKLNLPRSARIFLEAMHQAIYMRFDYGTVGFFRSPDNCQLTEFYDGAPVRFRLKIVDSDDSPGKVLADCNDIRPLRDDDDASSKQPLVPVHVVGGMGQRIWRVAWGSNNEPILELNQNCSNVKESITGNPLFYSLVMPAVFEEITTRIFRENLEGDAVDRWKSFFYEFQVDEFPPEEDEVGRIQWLRDATDNYSAGLKFADHWTNARSETSTESSTSRKK